MATTIAANIITKLNETEEGEHLMLLLDLFSDIEAVALPIDGLVDFVLTADTYDDLWLLTDDHKEIWDKAIALIGAAAERIPQERVLAALDHVVTVATVVPIDADADDDRDMCLEQLVLSFAPWFTEFPAAVLVTLLQHQRTVIRLVGLDVLWLRNREAEMSTYLHDPSAAVRSFVLHHAWQHLAPDDVRVLATVDPSEAVRLAATQALSNLAQQFAPLVPLV